MLDKLSEDIFFEILSRMKVSDILKLVLEYSTMTNPNARQSAVLAVRDNQHEG